MEEISQEIRDAVQKATIDNRLSCAKAHELAEKLDVSLAIIGQAAEEMKIKISKCQLGCF